MLRIEIEENSKDNWVLTQIREGIKSIGKNNAPIKYILVHNLVAQWLHQDAHTKETKEGYFFDGIKVVHSKEIEFHEIFILTK